MYAGFVERFGSGIPKMIKSCAEEGNPKPEYTLYDKSISLTLKPSEKYLNLVKGLYGSGKVVDDVVNNGQTVVDNVVNNRYGIVDNGVNKQPTETFELPGMKAPDRRKKLVELIAANGDVSIEDMALIMSVAKRTIDRDLSWLKDHGYIKKLGKTKDVKWVVLETHGK